MKLRRFIAALGHLFVLLYAVWQKMFQRMVAYSTHRVEIFGAPYIIFGFLGAANLFALPLFLRIKPFSLIGQTVYYLQVIGSSMGFLLVMKDFWPRPYQKYLPFIWHVTLLFCLPFLATVVFLLAEGNVYALLYCVLTLFFLGALVDWLTYVILFFLGTCFGFLGYGLWFGWPTFIDVSHLFLGIYALLFALAMGVIFSRLKEKALSEKILDFRTLSGTIAHEMRTPLASVSVAAQGLQECMPILIENYEQTLVRSNAKRPISQLRLSLLKELPQQLLDVAGDAMNTIELLLGRMREAGRPVEQSLVDIDDCIQSALNGYALRSNEKSLISWHRENKFHFVGHKQMVIYIIYNLLRNSIYFINLEKRGTIKIWYEEKLFERELHFKDTAKGIPASDLPHIFDYAFSRRSGGEGVGLYYCRKAMRAMAGDIKCFAQEGKYAEFVLLFPKVKDLDSELLCNG